VGRELLEYFYEFENIEEGRDGKKGRRIYDLRSEQF